MPDLDVRSDYASLVSSPRRFKRIVLPTLWLVIGSVVAVSLAVLAFGGASNGGDDPLVPTATNQSETVPVETAPVENTLSVDGTVAIDAPVDAKAPDAGTLAYVWVPDGAAIKKGAPLYQLKVPSESVSTGGDEVEDGEDAAPAAPTFRYVTVTAPASGKVSGLTTKLGDDVDDDAVVAKIRRESFTVTGSVSPLDRYRLLDAPGTATVTINGGPEPFECSDLTIADQAEESTDEPSPEDPLAYEESGGESGAGTAVTCKVPSDVTVFDGLTASMEIDAGSVEDALTVPVTAVRGLVEKGAVWVMGDDGEPTQRAVTLGLSDGSVVQVVKGLAEGDEVLRYVPGSSPEEQMDGGFEGEVVY